MTGQHKKTGTLTRICDDFKVTVNPVLNAEQYPPPLIEDICVTGEGTCFSKIYLAQVYLQMEVEESWTKYSSAFLALNAICAILLLQELMMTSICEPTGGRVQIESEQEQISVLHGHH